MNLGMPDAATRLRSSETLTVAFPTGRRLTRVKSLALPKLRRPLAPTRRQDFPSQHNSHSLPEPRSRFSYEAR